jgi:pimeloyl-ACP methyl ester carboxylesterase
VIKKSIKNVLLTCVLSVIGLLAFGQPSDQLPSDSTRFGNNPVAGRYEKINGINLYYEIYGSGEPLLMIHGNGGSISSFFCQIPYFAKQYKVIAVDSRAQGKSADLQDTLSFEMMADDFSVLIDRLGIKSCNVLGWSDGGINGLLMAIRHPDKVKRLAITGANITPDSSAISGADYQWMANYYDTLSKAPQTDAVKHDRKLVGLDLFQPHITPEQLKSIRCPVLVIGGDHDIIKIEHTALIAKSIPGAYLWILPNSSHGTLIDYREKFNQEVDSFFNDRIMRNTQGSPF